MMDGVDRWMGLDSPANELGDALLGEVQPRDVREGHLLPVVDDLRRDLQHQLRVVVLQLLRQLATTTTAITTAAAFLASSVG